MKSLLLHLLVTAYLFIHWLWKEEQDVTKEVVSLTKEDILVFVKAFLHHHGFEDMAVEMSDLGEHYAVYMPDLHKLVLDEGLIEDVNDMHPVRRRYFLESIALHEMGHALTPELEEIMYQIGYHRFKARMDRRADYQRFHTQAALNLSIHLEKRAAEIGRTYVNVEKHPQLLLYFDEYNEQNIRNCQDKAREQLEVFNSFPQVALTRKQNDYTYGGTYS